MLRKTYSVLGKSTLCRNYFSPKASSSKEEAREKVLGLYRHVIRWLPFIKDRYNVPGNLQLLRERIRMDFDKHKELQLDTSLIDAMVFRSFIELEEVKRQHQTRPHVISYFIEKPELKDKLMGRQRLPKAEAPKIDFTQKQINKTEETAGKKQTEAQKLLQRMLSMDE